MSRPAYTNSQAAIKKIQQAKRQLGLDNEAYESVLLTHGGVIDVDELKPSGINNVLKHFESMVADSAKNTATYYKKNKTYKSTPLKKLQDLFAGKPQAWDDLL